MFLVNCMLHVNFHSSVCLCLHVLYFFFFKIKKNKPDFFPLHVDCVSVFEGRVRSGTGHAPLCLDIFSCCGTAVFVSSSFCFQQLIKVCSAQQLYTYIFSFWVSSLFKVRKYFTYVALIHRVQSDTLIEELFLGGVLFWVFLKIWCLNEIREIFQDLINFKWWLGPG